MIHKLHYRAPSISQILSKSLQFYSSVYIASRNSKFSKQNSRGCYGLFPWIECARKTGSCVICAQFWLRTLLHRYNVLRWAIVFISDIATDCQVSTVNQVQLPTANVEWRMFCLLACVFSALVCRHLRDKFNICQHAMTEVCTLDTACGDSVFRVSKICELLSSTPHEISLYCSY